MAEDIGQTESNWGELLKDPWANLESLYPKLSEKNEYRELRSWYSERTAALPRFQEKKAPLADGEVWIARLDGEGRVVRIERSDGLFYSVEARTFSKLSPDGSVLMEWTQPVLVAKETSTDTKLFGKEVKVPVNGFLGIIKDTEGRILTTVDQEATAETPNHAIVRLAIQASAGKIALMRSGKPEADRQLYDLLKIYAGGDIEKLLARAEFILPIAPEDTNRDYKHNLALVMPAIESDSNLHRELEGDGTRKWLSSDQLAMTNVARLTNSHTMAAIKIGHDAELLREN